MEGDQNVKLLENNKIYDTDRSNKEYRLDIISKRTTLYHALLTIDYNNRNVIILSEKDKIQIDIKFNDILGLIDFDESIKLTPFISSILTEGIQVILII